MYACVCVHITVIGTEAEWDNSQCHCLLINMASIACSPPPPTHTHQMICDSTPPPPPEMICDSTPPHQIICDSTPPPTRWSVIAPPHQIICDSTHSPKQRSLLLSPHVCSCLCFIDRNGCLESYHQHTGDKMTLHSQLYLPKSECNFDFIKHKNIIL